MKTESLGSRRMGYSPLVATLLAAVLFLVAAIGLGTARAAEQVPADPKVGEACKGIGWARMGDDALVCRDGAWAKFSTAGQRDVLITYTVFNGTKNVRSGFMRTREGSPAAEAKFTKMDYLADGGMDANGLLLQKQETLDTGISLMFLPVLSSGGVVTMRVSFSQAILNSMRTIEKGGRFYQEPNVSRVDYNQDVVLALGKESVFELGVSPADTTSKYTLKIIASTN